jgi:hypothetical protein
MNKLANWLNQVADDDVSVMPLTDFERLCEELRQADVILVEGKSRVSEVIKAIINSPWTHSALYIGRLDEIRDGTLQNKVAEHYNGDPHEQLLIEAMLGEGTVIHPVKKYQSDHLRICRPKGLSKQDRNPVIAYALNQLGYEYDVRHLLDLARFLLPYTLIPRRWRSTLFQHNAGQETRNLCSYMIADAFASVSFPILPIAERCDNGKFKLYKRNPRLFTPKDFDYSPYFDIIKYPYLGFDEVAAYRALPWDMEGMICNAEGDCFIPVKDTEELIASSKSEGNTDNLTDKISDAVSGSRS